MGEVFTSLLAAQSRDPEFAEAYAAESARIAAIDSVINRLNEERELQHLSKAELARRASITPSAVRRLLTSDAQNPTLGTVSEVAAALGFRITLEPLA